MADLHSITEEARVGRIQKLTEGLRETRSGKLVRLIIRELVALDCQDILERVNANMKINLSVALKRDLIDFCRLEMEMFDLEVLISRKRRQYLGVGGSTTEDLDAMPRAVGIAAIGSPEKRAKYLTKEIDEPTRRRRAVVEGILRVC